VENLFHDLLFWVTIRRSNQLNYAPAYIAPLLPDCSLPFPPLPGCIRNCPKVP
jgi:hypothetical protein